MKKNCLICQNDNGRTLCKECHKKTDTYAGKGFKRSLNTNV